MINLLPEAHKNELRAARTNVILLNYNIMTVAAIGIMIVACGLFYVYLTSTKDSALEANQQKTNEARQYASTRAEAEEYKKNLATAKQILDNQVNYTDVIFGITNLLPKGVVLDNLNLTAKDFGSQTVLSAHAANYDAIAQLKSNFEKSKLFSNVYLQTITESSDQSDKNHPISVNISVKINKVTN